MAGKKQIFEEAPRQIIECAFAASGCARPAQIRRKLPTGKANLCLACDARLHQERSAKWCLENGLTTTQKKIDYCRAMAKKMFRGVSFSDARTPGEDDEITDKKLASAGA